MRDFLNVASDGMVRGRTLDATPWEIAVEVAHKRIEYGQIISEMHGGYLLKNLKQTIFRAVRDAVSDHAKVSG